MMPDSTVIKFPIRPAWGVLLWIAAAGAGCGGREHVVSQSEESVSTDTAPTSETDTSPHETAETGKAPEAPWALRWRNRDERVPADLFYVSLGRALSTSPIFKSVQTSNICGFEELGIEVVADGERLDAMGIRFDEAAAAAKQAVPPKVAARARVDTENRTVRFVSLQYHWDDEERLEHAGVQQLMRASVGPQGIALTNLAEIQLRPLSAPQRCEDEAPCIYMRFSEGTRRESVANAADAVEKENPHLMWELLPIADAPCFSP